MDHDPGEIEKIVAAVGFEDIFFEIGPGRWPELAIFLFKELGPEVNVENLDWVQVPEVEGMRLWFDPFDRFQMAARRRSKTKLVVN